MLATQTSALSARFETVGSTSSHRTYVREDNSFSRVYKHIQARVNKCISSMAYVSSLRESQDSSVFHGQVLPGNISCCRFRGTRYRPHLRWLSRLSSSYSFDTVAVYSTVKMGFHWCNKTRSLLIRVSRWKRKYFVLQILRQMASDSVVGTMAHYWLDGSGIESQCWRDFPHQSGPALGPAQPSIQWVPGHSRWVKRLGGEVNHPPPSSTEVKERIELYLTPVLGFHGLF